MSEHQMATSGARDTNITKKEAKAFLLFSCTTAMLWRIINMASGGLSPFGII